MIDYFMNKTIFFCLFLRKVYSLKIIMMETINKHVINPLTAVK